MAEKDNVFTVTQLTNLIKTMLEGTFPNVQLRGEISNFKINSTSGHMYFVLKDMQSQISAVMFRGRAAYLDFTPKDGMMVTVQGSISVYGPRGNYQIIASSMHQAGIGDIMEMIEKRKRLLAAEGLFDSDRKKNLPPYPKTVGIVTSPTGAALRDILQIIRRRNDSVNVTVLPAQVQGDGAAETIVRMIRAANRWKLCDILIVGRGGGSIEDLLPFSDESVVRAVAESEIPTVSAVGHEIDLALTDYAADVRAPTPSAAAEIAVPLKNEIVDRITRCRDEMHAELSSRLMHMKMTLKLFQPENMEAQFRRIEQPLQIRLDSARDDLRDAMQKAVEGYRLRIRQCGMTLENCNPQNILDRGYSMVCDAKTGRVIRSAEETEKGAELTIRPARGLISATVN